VFFSAKSVECFLLSAEGFSCSLDVLYGDLGISLLPFLIKKDIKKFLCYIFFFLVKPPDPDLLDMLDPDPDSISPDPQHYPDPVINLRLCTVLGERKAARDSLHGGLHHPHYQRPPLQGRLRRLPHGGESTVLLFIFKGTPSSQIRSA
jgi:hypothetical protein